MSAKYTTGNYAIILFDRYGTKINTIPLDIGGLLYAQDEGNKAIEKGDCASFVVVRMLYNSMDIVHF